MKKNVVRNSAKKCTFPQNTLFSYNRTVSYFFSIIQTSILDNKMHATLSVDHIFFAEKYTFITIRVKFYDSDRFEVLYK